MTKRKQKNKQISRKCERAAEAEKSEIFWKCTTFVRCSFCKFTAITVVMRMGQRNTHMHTHTHKMGRYNSDLTLSSSNINDEHHLKHRASEQGKPARQISEWMRIIDKTIFEHKKPAREWEGEKEINTGCSTVKEHRQLHLILGVGSLTWHDNPTKKMPKPVLIL